MSELTRFGASVDNELLQSFDRLIEGQGYENRSEALRDLMRDALVKSRLETSPEDSEALGSLANSCGYTVNSYCYGNVFNNLVFLI